MFTHSTNARIMKAKLRWTITTSAGVSSQTTQAPSRIWAARMIGTAVAGITMWRTCLAQTQAAATCARMTVETSAATQRWLDSIQAATLGGGRSCPWHRGQSGQPSPEPVERTMAPTTINK